MPVYALPSLINSKLMNQSGSTLGRQAAADQEISVVPVKLHVHNSKSMYFLAFRNARFITVDALHWCLS